MLSENCCAFGSTYVCTRQNILCIEHEQNASIIEENLENIFNTSATNVDFDYEKSVADKKCKTFDSSQEILKNVQFRPLFNVFFITLA